MCVVVFSAVARKFQTSCLFSSDENGQCSKKSFHLLTTRARSKTNAELVQMSEEYVCKSILIKIIFLKGKVSKLRQKSFFHSN